MISDSWIINQTMLAVNPPCQPGAGDEAKPPVRASPGRFAWLDMGCAMRAPSGAINLPGRPREATCWLTALHARGVPGPYRSSRKTH